MGVFDSELDVLRVELAPANDDGVLDAAGDEEVAVRVEVAEGEAHREPVHLRLGQRIGAAKLHRVLRSNDEEKIVQRVRFALDADLPLGHRLEQR